MSAQLQAVVSQRYETPDLMHSSLAGSIRDFTSQKSTTIEQLIEVAHKIRFCDEDRGVPVKEDDKMAAIDSACQHYLACRLSQKFPLIDHNLFELRRFLTIEWADGSPSITGDSMIAPDGFPRDIRNDKNKKVGTQLSVNLLQCLSVENLNEPVRMNSFDTASRGGRNYRISARFPSTVPPASNLLANECQALMYEVMAELLRAPAAIADTTRRLRSKGWRHWSEIKPTAEVGWVPTKESIYFDQAPELPPGDPVLFVRLGDQRFLVAEWETAEEEPISHLLREFIG